MNIYRYELRSQLKSFITWTVSIVFFFVVFMIGLYPSFRDSMNDVLKIYSGFPPEFSAAFGINIKAMFSFGGFYCFIYLYLAVVAAIMAVSVSVATFAREKRSKCTDFLLAKPISRSRIFLTKALANLTLMAMTNIIFILASVISYKTTLQEPSGTGTLILAACSMFLTQLVFWALGLFYAVFMKKIRSVSGVATAFGFGAFIISALHGILKEDTIRFIAPLKYFDPIAVFDKGSYELVYAAVGAIVIIACVASSYIRYCQSDTHAV